MRPITSSAFECTHPDTTKTSDHRILFGIIHITTSVFHNNEAGWKWVKWTQYAAHSFWLLYDFNNFFLLLGLLFRFILLSTWTWQIPLVADRVIWYHDFCISKFYVVDDIGGISKDLLSEFPNDISLVVVPLRDAIWINIVN